MASQPPCAPCSPECLDEDGKTVSQLRSVQLPSVLSSDLEQLFHKLPGTALIRAYGRFKLSTLEARQDGLLAPFDPLEVSKDSPPPQEHPKPEKKFWGDQETLSKVRLRGWGEERRPERSTWGGRSEPAKESRGSHLVLPARPSPP